MKTETIEIRRIIPDEGMVLTNGYAYADPGEPVYLGCTDKQENWHEIPYEEYEAKMREQEEHEVI